MKPIFTCHLVDSTRIDLAADQLQWLTRLAPECFALIAARYCTAVFVQ